LKEQDGVELKNGELIYGDYIVEIEKLNTFLSQYEEMKKFRGMEK